MSTTFKVLQLPQHAFAMEVERNHQGQVAVTNNQLSQEAQILLHKATLHVQGSSLQAAKHPNTQKRAN